MAEFTTPEWIEELAESLGSVTLGSEVAVVLEQRVTGPAEAVWHIEVAAGRAEVGQGPHPRPTVTLTVDRATAEAIHHGHRSAQRAFLDGDLRIGGDVGALLAARELLAAIIAARPPSAGPTAT